ncbi:hypothetical protein RHGRI_025588 [Rhododendron griersonianum]|uniref:Uncharacterized protein n=1 Tax=Rhododendron griersonianum TaxID=479676 RepID=A0AAV6IV22_9ERIC|nr:hypothetical protein RHGRI_025588 [Rhododendron griersonianum]
MAGWSAGGVAVAAGGSGNGSTGTRKLNVCHAQSLAESWVFDKVAGHQGFSSMTRHAHQLLLDTSVQFCLDYEPYIVYFQGKVKQIVGSTIQDLKEGSSTQVTNFESDKSAAEYVNIYKEDGLTGGHVIMIGASKSATMEELHAYPGRQLLLSPYLLVFALRGLVIYSLYVMQAVRTSIKLQAYTQEVVLLID